SNRSRGRDAVRVQPTKQQPAAPTPRLNRRLCQRCGLLLSVDGRRAKQTYCGECREMVREEALGRFQAAGPATLARQRAAGGDSSHSDVAQGKRRATQAARTRARATWAGATQTDPAAWQDILARLQPVSLGAMRKATGLSLTYCAQIKRGRVPHPIHWAALQAIPCCTMHPRRPRAHVSP